MDRKEQELLLIEKYLNIVKEAGFGEVVIRVTDGHVVNISHSAQKGLKLPK